MKVSYLILAHNNFKHLDRLFDSLDDVNNSFFVHIDKKVNLKSLNQRENVKVIPQRFDIKWGGYSMVEATLALMNFAVENKPNSDYYVLISGVDYPIRPKSFLLDLLSQGKEYIDIAPLPVPYKPKERYEYYYFDYDRRNISYCNPLFLIEKGLTKLNIKRTLPFPIYVGSQWFALTNKCVNYILDTVRKDSHYEHFFKHTLVPDEAFFQTIIGNSPFYSKVAANLTYTDWSVSVPPALIDNTHVDFLKKNFEFNDEYGQRFPYFARKFNDDCGGIIKRIERELRSDI